MKYLACEKLFVIRHIWCSQLLWEVKIDLVFKYIKGDDDEGKEDDEEGGTDEGKENKEEDKEEYNDDGGKEDEVEGGDDKDKEGSSSEVNVMTENKLPLYNEIPISHIQHDFFDESDNETIRSDSEINENNNLETVFTFNNESLHACKLAGEKEEITDDELLLLESFSDSNKSIINFESSLPETEESLILFKDNNISQILTACYVIDTINADHNSVIINNQLLIFGGIKTDADYIFVSAYELFYLDLLKPFDNTNLSWNLIPEGNLLICVSLSAAVVTSDNSTVFLIGGFLMTKNRDYNYSSLVYEYNYSTKKWDTPSITGVVPARQAIRGVIDNSGIIYIFANILPNGIIIYIGGFEYFENTTKTIPININNIRLFDTKKYEWSQMNATGETVDSRWFHTSVLTPDGYIVIFGGCTFEGEFSNVYSVSPNLAILDTNNSLFEWTIPESSKVNSPPFMCSHAASLYYNYMIITFGFVLGNGTWINSSYNSDVHLYDTTSNKWVTNFNPPVINNPTKKSSSKALIIGLTTGGAVIILILIVVVAFIFYKKREKVIKMPGNATTDS
ncbi:hypothetical protein Glove_441g75 [Diversispora epigaea]|uniref:Kelch repeat protein n=1 Tax=Diversispora epigaea TaxID=1348612 RepID=A0A397GTA7_9GLOM|nr:hypothetical protein Glove_441g75 [Diversispora epigaea]